MAKAQFHKNQRVFVKPVGTWALVEHVVPHWTTPPLPRIPLFEDVLRRYGHHAVLCLEAKRDADYPAMIAMVERFGLQDSIIVKAYYTSDVISVAKRAGYPIFAYVASGVAEEKRTAGGCRSICRRVSRR